MKRLQSTKKKEKLFKLTQQEKDWYIREKNFKETLYEDFTTYYKQKMSALLKENINKKALGYNQLDEDSLAGIMFTQQLFMPYFTDYYQRLEKEVLDEIFNSFYLECKKLKVNKSCEKYEYIVRRIA